jgi:hypothetical protein
MRVIEPKHPTTLATTGIRFVILRDLEMVDEMLELLLEALLIHENALGMDHSRISEVQRDIEAEFKSLENQNKRTRTSLPHGHLACNLNHLRKEEENTLQIKILNKRRTYHMNSKGPPGDPDRKICVIDVNLYIINVEYKTSTT